MAKQAPDLMAILCRPNGIPYESPLTTSEIQPYPPQIIGTSAIKWTVVGIELASLAIKSATGEHFGRNLLCLPRLSQSAKFGIFMRTANGRIWKKNPYKVAAGVKAIASLYVTI